MAIVTGFTADRMLEIEQSAIVDGEIVGDNLILEPKGFVTDPGTYPKIDAGNVRGPQGDTGPTGEVTTAAMDAAIAVAHAAGAITETQLASASVVTSKISNLAVTEAKIASNAVTTDKLATSAVTNAKLAPDSVNGSKIADNSINSEHYVDGSIDRVHLSADIIDGTKLANDSVNSEHYVNSSIDHEHIFGTATGGTLAGGSIWYTKILGWVFIGASGATESSNAGTLPSGYRPAQTVSGPCVDHYGTNTPYPDSAGSGRVIIGSGGVVNTDNDFGTAVSFFFGFPAA